MLALVSGVVVGAVVLASGEERVAATNVAGPVNSEPYPGPAAGRVIGDWEIVGTHRGAGGGFGFTTSFFAINRSEEARTPDNLYVVGRTEDGQRERLRASCTRAHSSLAGPRDEPVGPGERVLVACRFPRLQHGVIPRLDHQSMRILAVPCEGSGRRGGGGPL